MTFENIVQALIPLDYREQVLGDLQERGFRLRDIANVLPRVWWTHAARQWTGPVPRMSAASDAAILARTEQLARQGARPFYGLVLLFALFRLTSPNLHQIALWQRFAGMAVLGLCLIPVYFATIRRALPEPPSLDSSRPKLLTNYRRQIDYQVSLSRSAFWVSPLLIWVSWLRAWKLTAFNVFACSLAAGLTLMAMHRISRLRRELATLEAAK